MDHGETRGKARELIERSREEKTTVWTRVVTVEDADNSVAKMGLNLKKSKDKTRNREFVIAISIKLIWDSGLRCWLPPVSEAQ